MARVFKAICCASAGVVFLLWLSSGSAISGDTTDIERLVEPQDGPRYDPSLAEYLSLVPNSKYNSGRDILCGISEAAPGDKHVKISTRGQIADCIIAHWVFTAAAVLDPETGRDVIIQPGGVPNQPSTLLMYVYSAPGNGWFRQMVRATWGSRRYHARTQYLQPYIIFVIGLPRVDVSGRLPQNLTSQLVEESRVYDDLLMLNFTDGYEALTLKGIAVQTWITNRLPKVRYIFKTDDDVIIDTNLWVAHAQKLHTNASCGPCMACMYLYSGAWPLRKGRYQVTQNEYSAHPYPDYCGGYGYVMTREAMAAILDAASRVPLFRMEDIFLTGLAASKTNIQKWQIEVKDNHTLPIEEVLDRRYKPWMAMWTKLLESKRKQMFRH